MTDRESRERLIELLQGARNKYINLLPFEKELIADHLIASGVIVPIRCKDCKYSRPRNESEKHIYFEDVLICESCEMADEPCAVCCDDYCSYGELKECEGK